MNDNSDMNEWDEQINALVDGQLNAVQASELQAAAKRDPTLAAAISEAFELQQLMATLPELRAPATLREKLRRIPQEHASPRGVSVHTPGRWAWLQPGWAMALAAVPLVIAFGINQSWLQSDRIAPSEAELAQARRDLALAFAYLEKASLSTGRQIEYSIEVGMRDPVTNNTLRSIAEPFEFNKEPKS